MEIQFPEISKNDWSWGKVPLTLWSNRATCFHKRNQGLNLFSWTQNGVLTKWPTLWSTKTWLLSQLCSPAASSVRTNTLWRGHEYVLKCFQPAYFRLDCVNWHRHLSVTKKYYILILLFFLTCHQFLPLQTYDVPPYSLWISARFYCCCYWSNWVFTSSLAAERNDHLQSELTLFSLPDIFPHLCFPCLRWQFPFCLLNIVKWLP